MSKKKNNTTSTQVAASKQAAQPKKKNQKIEPFFEKTGLASGKWVGIALAIITVVTVLVYTPSLHNDFTNWDDHKYIYENPTLKDVSKQGLKTIWNTEIAANWHPITMLSLAWNYEQGKTIDLKTNVETVDTFPFHVTNLILHIINAILVFFVVFTLTKRNFLIAIVPAFFFAIHPMHVESIAWASARKDPLYSMFFLMGLLSYLVYLNSNSKVKKGIFYAIITGLFWLSCASKPAAVVFPVVLLLIDFFYVKIHAIKDMVMRVFEKAPWFAIFIYFGLLTVKVQKTFGAIGESEIYTFGQKLMFASNSMLKYWVYYLFPYKLCTFRPYPPISKLPTEYLIAPVLAIGVILAALWFFRKNKYVLFGLGFFFINIGLVLQLRSVGNAIMADRYAYMPYVGLSFLLGYALYSSFAQTNKTKAYALVAMLGLMSSYFLYQTFSQCKVWKNSGTLWAQVIENYPNDFTARYNHALYDSKAGNYEAALVDYTYATKLRTKSFQAYVNLGTVYNALKRYPEAITPLTTAIKIGEAETAAGKNLPEWKLGWANRAMVYGATKNYEAGLADYAKILERDPNDYNIRLNRGPYGVILGQANLTINKEKGPEYYQIALNDFNFLEPQMPANADLYYNRSLAYSNLGQREKAIPDVQKAMSLGKKIDDIYKKWLGI